MKIAITGTTGYIGKNLVKRLNNFFDIILFDREKHDLLNKNSLRNFLQDANCVIHLAGVHKNNRSEVINKINIDGTKTLLEAMIQYCPGSKLIFSSSSQVYMPKDIYGSSKKKAEEYIKEYSKDQNIRSIILRFSNIYGPNLEPFKNSVIATFIYQIFHDELITINGDGSLKRDYLFIEDAIYAIERAINYNPKDTEVFDICTGKLTSLSELIDKCTLISGKKALLTYNQNQKFDNFTVARSYDMAKKKLKWKPTVTIENGLKKLYNHLYYENTN